jgi:malonyl-CoA O-methyltransferase
LLRSSDEVIAIAEKYLNAQFEVLHTSLEFDSVREMFRYIKRSGVSGGRRVLDFAQTKRLMEAYPLNYLEFEIVFIVL